MGVEMGEPLRAVAGRLRQGEAEVPRICDAAAPLSPNESWWLVVAVALVAPARVKQVLPYALPAVTVVSSLVAMVVLALSSLSQLVGAVRRPMVAMAAITITANLVGEATASVVSRALKRVAVAVAATMEAVREPGAAVAEVAAMPVLTPRTSWEKRVCTAVLVWW
jgi:hypothetical protein